MDSRVSEYYNLSSKLYSENLCSSVNFIGSFIDSFLEKLPDGATVGDLGCGPGDEAAGHSHRLHFSGVDVSSKVLDIYSSKVSSSKTFCNSIDSLPFEDNTFDSLLFLFSILHLNHEKGKLAIKEAHRVLKPGCEMLFATATANSNMSIEAIHPEFKEVDFLYPIPFFLWNISELRDILESTGFEIKSEEVGPIAEGRSEIVKLVAKKKGEI